MAGPSHGAQEFCMVPKENNDFSGMAIAAIVTSANTATIVHSLPAYIAPPFELLVGTIVRHISCWVSPSLYAGGGLRVKIEIWLTEVKMFSCLRTEFASSLMTPSIQRFGDFSIFPKPQTATVWFCRTALARTRTLRCS